MGAALRRRPRVLRLAGRRGPHRSRCRAQLARYFQPQEDDEPGAKGPAPAHRAIAQLVKRGSIRGILTTDFDRLTERALEEAGFSPQVIGRPSQIPGMMPLPHAPVTVIKLHRGHAAPDQLSTVDELETYDSLQQDLLKRVLDEYGLIICGWSADRDTALVRALEGVRPRRYPMFWSSFSTLGEAFGGDVARARMAYARLVDRRAQNRRLHWWRSPQGGWRGGFGSCPAGRTRECGRFGFGSGKSGPLIGLPRVRPAPVEHGLRCP